MKRITLLDTAVGSTNKGDEIIMRCCKEELSLGGYFVLNAPTHLKTISMLESIGVLPDSANEISRSEYKFVCGTNLLQSNMLHRSNQWDIDLLTCKPFANSILVGVGGHVAEIGGIKGKYTAELYKKVLSHEYIHSVRTKAAEEDLTRLGFKAINTGCVTLWKLSPDFCAGIPKEKGRNAIVTLTDYNRDAEKDRLLLEVVIKNYQKVYFWPQGIYDDEYLRELGFEKDLIVLPADVDAYERVLNNEESLDYIGTRFHGGIFAMRHQKRCIIISLDERMTAMQERIKNNVISRSRIGDQLEKIIQSEFETFVDINLGLIATWKAQFR